VADAPGDRDPGRADAPRARPESPSEPGADARRDRFGRDAGRERARETAPDAGREPEPDAGRLVGPDAGREPKPDAGREPGADVVRARPVRLRRVAFGTAAVVVVLFVGIAALLGRTSSEGVEFGRGDQVAMVLLGVLVAVGVLVLARPTVVADLDGVRVQNIFTTKDVPWEVVRAVSFPDGTPWAMLDLADDDQIALLAVQAADGQRAVSTVRALRTLHARHAAGEGHGPSRRSHGVT
jgi:Bacterial PH domain